MASHRRCFFIMPFKAELNYFYLYVKQHVESKHNVECFRGDTDVLTIPVLEKIKKYIEDADVLIADCSGRNPNVFYELGIAHTLNKKVILISMDDVREAPADIRHYEFINYQLEKHEEFLAKLDNALRGVFVENYVHLYEKALEILGRFRIDTASNVQPVRRELFIAKVMANERRKPIPDGGEELSLRKFLLLLIVDVNEDIDLLEKVTLWLTRNAPGESA